MTPSKAETASAHEGFSLVSNMKLLSLYSAMLECRRFAEHSGNGFKKIRTTGSAESILGHEAVVVGTAIDLLPHDTVAPCLMPEDSLKAVNPSVSTAPSFSLASRNALANGTGQKLTVLFSSGSRTAHPSWLRAMTVAADHNLPMLFVSVDSEETSGKPSGIATIPLKKKGHAFPFISVDGSDVVAVYRVASEAITHARKGHGPTLFDCRLQVPGDPIQNMRKYLLGKGLNPAQFTA